MKALIQKIVNLTGYQIRKFPDPPDLDIQRRMMLIEHFEINKILDVGANQGQYASSIRKFGFQGEIISFEPMKEAFSLLQELARQDPGLTAVNYALGDTEAKTTINVAGNSISSSILEMLPAHIDAAPHSTYIDKEEITIKTLDSVFFDYCRPEDNIFLKMDTQGFEKNVLDGATETLEYIKGIQVEMSLVPLYRGGILFDEMKAYLKGKGFDLYSLENGFWHVGSGRLLCVDGIFFKASEAKS